MTAARLIKLALLEIFPYLNNYFQRTGLAEWISKALVFYRGLFMLRLDNAICAASYRPLVKPRL